MPWRDDVLLPLEDADSGHDRIRMRLNTERGTLRDSVVQYEVNQAEGGDGYVAVVRYGESHGRAHRDLLDDHGRTVRKTWMPDHMSMDGALKLALADIRQNWRRYFDDFRWRSR